MRHNRVRDLEADLMKEVCHNVQVEPELLPIEKDRLGGNTKKKARLDVAGVGVWGAYEKTFLDIRIMHPNADSYINKPIDEVYLLHENIKKEHTMNASCRLRGDRLHQLLGLLLEEWGQKQTDITNE